MWVRGSSEPKARERERYTTTLNTITTATTKTNEPQGESDGKITGLTHNNIVLFASEPLGEGAVVIDDGIVVIIDNNGSGGGGGHIWPWL